MKTLIIVSEWFDWRGYGLSKAALSFTEHTASSFKKHYVISHPPSGKETTLNKCHYVRGNAFNTILKTPAALLPLASTINPGIVHFHGIWTGGIGLIPQLKKLNYKIVVSPHGMCEPYIRNRNFLKKIALDIFFHRRCLLQADLLHALNEHEHQSISDYLGLNCPPIISLPNGISPVEGLTTRSDLARSFIFCGRFDPKKNIEGLLDAWIKSNVASKGNRLIIAGNYNSPYGMHIWKMANSIPGIILPGEISGIEKEKMFRSSHFGVLASHSEGLPIAALESLSYGQPCILSLGCNMNHLPPSAAWIVNANKFAEIFVKASELTNDEYNAMSTSAVNYTKAHHDWIKIGEGLSSHYHNILAAP